MHVRPRVPVAYNCLGNRTISTLIIELIAAYLLGLLSNGKNAVVMNDRTDDIGRRFDSLDADGNGLLSPNELIGVIVDTLGYDQSKAKQFVDSFDVNKDGSIDKKEFVGMWSIMFG